MADSFNPELFFKRCDREIIREFIEKKDLKWQLNWDAKPQKFARELFTAYATDSRRDELETTLCEIHAISQMVGTVPQLIKVASEEGQEIPEKLKNMSAHNISLWLYTNAQDKWAKIARFIYADKLTDSMWFVADLEDAPDDPTWQAPDIDVLEKAISKNIYTAEVRGEHVQIIREQRDGNNEYFFVYFNDYRTSKSTYTDEAGFKHDSINIDAKTLIFHVQHDQNRIRARIEKRTIKRKKELCDLVATIMLNRHIIGLTKTANVYDLSQFLNPVQGDLFYDCNGALTVDEFGEIQEARVSEIGVRIPGSMGEFQVKEEQGKVYEVLRDKLDNVDFFKSGQEIEHVSIRLLLDDSYGRSRKQTLRLTPNAISNSSRNSRVTELIDKTLKRWHIDPQA